LLEFHVHASLWNHLVRQPSDAPSRNEALLGNGSARFQEELENPASTVHAAFGLQERSLHPVAAPDAENAASFNLFKAQQARRAVCGVTLECAPEAWGVQDLVGGQTRPNPLELGDDGRTSSL
jgi:hypothetical protein